MNINKETLREQQDKQYYEYYKQQLGHNQVILTNTKTT